MAGSNLSAADTNETVQPNRIDGLGLWLSAGDLVKTHAEGQRVTTWPDKSGHGFDAVYERRVPEALRETGIHRPPRFNRGAKDGIPAVSFNAADRQTLVLNLAGRALGQGVNGFSAVFLVQPALDYDPSTGAISTWPEGRVLFITHLSNFDLRFSVQLMENTGEVRLCSRPRPGLSRDTISSFAEGARPALRGGAWHRLMLSVDYQTRKACIFIDGKAAVQALPPGKADVFENLPSGITGIGSNTLGAWATFQLAEMLCYEKSLSVDEMNALDAYLREKHRF